ncbi:MAG: hypothetical protein J5680_04100 [Neisseriaceae bacterium]|nr:hypothetical protein [Neisseriaceae bacterium]MBR5676243.1 hypothetical protein [Neisseriaceae bacterium]
MIYRISGSLNTVSSRRVGILAHRNGRIQYNGRIYFRLPENPKKRVGNKLPTLQLYRYCETP